MLSRAFFFLMTRRPPRSTRTDTLFPYPTLFRSFLGQRGQRHSVDLGRPGLGDDRVAHRCPVGWRLRAWSPRAMKPVLQFGDASLTCVYETRVGDAHPPVPVRHTPPTPLALRPGTPPVSEAPPFSHARRFPRGAPHPGSPA